MQSRIFTIIVNYNSTKWIKKTVESIKNSSHPLKTVIVDNNSTDESLDWIENNFSDAHIIRSKTNLGFGKANNLGIKCALENGADFVFLQNQDLYLHPGCIKYLLNASNISDKYAILSPLHYDGEGIKLDYFFSTFISPPKCNNLISDLLLLNPLDQIYTTTMVNAAAWFIPKQKLKYLGGFHPSFFHYGEDSNYCQRVLSLNLKIGVVPNAIVYHDRESRPISKYATDELIIFERLLHKNFCFPGISKPFSYFFSLLIIEFLLGTLKLNKKATSLSLKKMNLLIFKFPLTEIKKINRKFKINDFSYIRDSE
jgi:GT2 family glycosyltransferase